MAGDIWLSPRFPRLSLYIWTAALFSMNDYLVEGHRCHADWCNYNEYCCGIDLCCDYLTGYWYIWLMTGLLVFSLILVCCWVRYHKYHSKESVESRNYIPLPGEVRAYYGDGYYIHQQPPQVPFAREPPIYTHHRMQRLPLHEMQQHEAARYYPPPYNYMERVSPTAPPPSP